jgi:hypothetical protein
MQGMNQKYELSRVLFLNFLLSMDYEIFFFLMNPDGKSEVFANKECLISTLA